MKLNSLLRYVTALFPLTLLLPSIARAAGDDAKPIDLNSRRELMVDDFLSSSREGGELKLHKPEARSVAITCDAPWEGNSSRLNELIKLPVISETLLRLSQRALSEWQPPTILQQRQLPMLRFEVT